MTLNFNNDLNKSIQSEQLPSAEIDLSFNGSESNMKSIEVTLNNKTDVQILSELQSWIGKEREAVTHVLYYLREVEERKLYLLEASSLFEFCMKVLKYSRHEAQARVDAMRLLKVVPEIDTDLDAGRLSLTVAAQTMSSFRKEDARRKASGERPLSKEERKTVLADLMSASTREADLKLATHFPDQPQPERTKPVSESLTRIEFNVTAESKKKLERLQAYYFHQTGGSWEKLFELLADHEIKKLDTPPRRAPGVMSVRKSKRSADIKQSENLRRFANSKPCESTNRLDDSQQSDVSRNTYGSKQASNSRQSGDSNRPQNPIQSQNTNPSEAPKQTQTPHAHNQPRTRYIRKQIHQQIWSKWEKGCNHRLENGDRCGSRRNLEQDHILEFSEGGANNQENLRLLCGAHNRYRSDRTQKLRREFVACMEQTRNECIEHIFREAIQSKAAVVFADSMC